MKKLLAGLLLGTLLFSANAQHRPYPHHHSHHGHNHWSWLFPAVIGGAVVYGVTRQPDPPPPVIVQQTLPPAPVGYRYINAIDPACNCYKYVLVPN